MPFATKSRVAAGLAAGLMMVSLTACRGGEGTPTEDAAGIKTDFGVTKEPCPEAIDATKGCIYLGSISDLTVGPFAPLAVPITAAQKAFWERVNKDGGIGGYEIDVTTYVRDNKYNPQTHNEVYQEIKPNILALAQTLGSPTTAAILEDLKASDIVALPAAWSSDFLFEDNIFESGASYCLEAMNAVEYFKGANPSMKSVMAIHYPGDYGDDGAAGARIAAEELGATFTDVVTGQGQAAQADAIAQVVSVKPDLVILSDGPSETGTIVALSALQGYQGRFIGNGPTWNPALLTSPAAGAVELIYMQAGPWAPWGADTAGHDALAAALTPTPSPLNDGYTAGWVWSYPLKAALEKAAEAKDLTRAGLLAAAKSLTSVDYEGMLPADAGNYAAGAGGAVRGTVISKPDKTAPTGVTVVKEYSVGSIAKDYDLTKPCYK